MYVCVCNAITERHIHEAVEQGAQRLRDLRSTLGVTAECGRCATCAHECLKSAKSALSGRNTAPIALPHAACGLSHSPSHLISAEARP